MTPLNANEAEFLSAVKFHRAMGYGRMLRMISHLWRDEAGDIALCVTDTFHGVAAKEKRCKEEGHDWRPGGDFDWCDRCNVNRPKKATAKS